MTTTRLLRTRTGFAISALISTIAALVGLGLVAPPLAGAAPGDVDTTFSGDGVQQVNGTGTQPVLTDVAVGADGSQTVVGWNQSGPSDTHAIVGRLLTDGSFDPAFGGGDGLLELTTAQMREADGVVIGPDGRVVIVGRVGSPSNIAVVRLNPDGSFDSTFDGDGVRIIDLASAQEYGFGVALDPSGRILVAAESNETSGGNDFHFVTLRLLTGGGLDPDFGVGGVVIEEGGSGPGDIDGARAVAVDASGRVLSAGQLGITGLSTGALFRYTAAGERDDTFDGDGMVEVEEDLSNTLQALVVDGDSPIVGGTTMPPGAGSQEAASFVIRRYTPAGATDASITTTGPDGGWNLLDLDRRADGYLVAAGTEVGPNTVTGRELRGAVAQLTPALALDTTFSGDGRVTIDLGEGDEASGVAYDLDGRPVVVGDTFGVNGTVVRLQNHTRQATLAAGGSLSTGAEATPGNPVVTTVTTPNAGLVSITERRTAATTANGFNMLGVAVDITAPDATAADPLRFTFRLDGSLVDSATTAPLATDVAGLAVFRNGTQLADCAANAGTAASPDPCLASKTMEGDDVVLAIRTSKASTWTFGVLPIGRYWMAASDGGVFTFGAAAFFGSTGDIKLNQPIVGMATAPDGKGYWLVASDGGIFSFGSAEFFGSTGNLKLNQPIVGMAAAPDGKGYWLVASDGGIFSFGSAEFFGSTGNLKLNQPIVGIDATPDGKGYWMVAKDGGIFSFGNAEFFGSTGNLKLNQPIVGMTATQDGKGYWMVASDGGIFTFGTATFLGSTGDIKLNKPIVAMGIAPDGQGYWMFASDGGVFSFGSAPFLGSLGDIRLNQPVVAGAA